MDQDNPTTWPHAVLVTFARAQGIPASTSHPKGQLVATVWEGCPLPPSPVDAIRERLTAHIKANPQIIALLDPDVRKDLPHHLSHLSDAHVLSLWLAPPLPFPMEQS